MAWAGGALFVASLALTAWWYFVQLGRVQPGGSWSAIGVNAILLTIFATHHSLFARESVKRRLTVVPETMIRSFYVWVASALLILVVVLWQPVGGELYHVGGAWALVNAAVQAVGLLFIARAVSGLDPLELAGIRQAAGVQPERERLQIAGPYRWVRHPLYLGWMLALFGAARMTGDRLAFAAITSAYLVLAVPWEERSLRTSFGEDYARYTQQVRWRIVPFIY
jgi:protein-S-isoprenylcysteine O-methyltransferase Ste14